MKTYIPEDIVWNGKFYAKGSFADVDDKLAASLNAPKMELEVDEEQPEEKRVTRRRKKEIEEEQPQPDAEIKSGEPTVEVRTEV